MLLLNRPRMLIEPSHVAMLPSWRVAQEINMLLCDTTAYLADKGRVNRKPKEESLLPPVALTDKLLVVTWVAILVPAANYIISKIPSENGL